MEVRFCFVYAEAVSGGRVWGRTRARLTRGKAGCSDQNRDLFLKTLMGLVAPESVTLSPDAVSFKSEYPRHRDVGSPLSNVISFVPLKATMQALVEEEGFS